MVTFKLVSGPVPALSLPLKALTELDVVYHGGAQGLREAFSKERFPRLTGMGHRVERPESAEPVTLYLTLLEKGEHGWEPARSDPR